MCNKVDIYGVNIHNVNMVETKSIIKSFLEEDCTHLVFTPNSEIIMAANRDTYLKEILNSSSLTVADGAGVVIASKIMGTPLKERVAGFDLTCNIFESEDFKKRSFFFFGAKPSIIEKAVQNIQKKYKINVVGYVDGYFNDEDEDHIIKTINSTKADFLFVALGAPKQEIWLHKNKHKLNSKVCIGVGGSFDVFSGVSKRAPIFFQKNNLEWLYRLIKEPWRYKRMLDLPRFLWQILLLKSRLTLKKLIK